MENPVLQIKDALIRALKKIDPDTDVFFEEIKSTDPAHGVEQPKTWYFVDLKPGSPVTVDGIYTDMSVMVDVTYHEKGESNNAYLIKAAEIDAAIRPVLSFGDRKITIGNANINVVDHVLHYIFTHAMDYGSWADWSWLKANVPVMCGWDGEIKYYLNPDDYTKKVDGTASDVSNANFAGNAMAVIKKIYKKEYKVGSDRYVYFCERQVDPDFQPVGFNVKGKVRDYMLIPMFYGSIDGNGRMRSIAGQWSCLTASGSSSDNSSGTAIGTTEQNTAILKTSASGLFFGGPLTNTLADICVMLTRSTDSQSSFGSGMCSSYVEDKAQHYGTQINKVVGGGRFYGSDDNKSFNKIFHSAVLGSYMLWQRDPYMVAVNGRIKVSTDYTYNLSGDGYLDTGCNVTARDKKLYI